MSSLPAHALRVVLVEPLIPANTGNIGRLCLATGCQLVLVGRLGFSLEAKSVRRAGLDHWPQVRPQVVGKLDDVIGGLPRDRVCLFDSAAPRALWQMTMPPDATLVFGNENPGLPAEVMAAWSDRLVRIPMSDHGGVRSLNLANAVAVVVYEALRQALSNS